jgi:hypothetical protein
MSVLLMLGDITVQWLLDQLLRGTQICIIAKGAEKLNVQRLQGGLAMGEEQMECVVSVLRGRGERKGRHWCSSEERRGRWINGR